MQSRLPTTALNPTPRSKSLITLIRSFSRRFFRGIFLGVEQRVTDNKMLPHLKVFFAAAHRDLRLSIQNKTVALYDAAHNATTNPDDWYLQQETIDAIENLGTATASDHTVITQLTATAVRLMTELATVNVKLVFALQINHANPGVCGGHDRTSRRKGSREGSITWTGASASSMAKEKYLETPTHYC